jgi:hypothetical protein
MSLQTKYYGLGGGLDLVTSPIEMPPGRVIAGINYEPIAEGYARIDGFEVRDGRPRPSDVTYWVLNFDAGVAAITEGQTVTGATSSASGKALIDAVVETGSYVGTDAAGYLVLTNVTGTFQNNENLQVAAVTKSVANGLAVEEGADNDTDHDTWYQDAVETARALIQKPAGSGSIRGTWTYNGDDYCFRDNAGSTAGVMYKATTSGWAVQALGREMQIAARSFTFTVTIAVPGVVTFNNHGLPNGTVVVLETTGALPTGLAIDTEYFVVNRAANTFELSLTAGGASITTSGSQSGTHTATAIPGEIVAGQTVTGVTSGATGVVTRAALRVGDWDAENLVATLTFATVTGTFNSSEALTVGGVYKAGTTTADTAITLPPGGRYDCCNHNFSGDANLLRMYFCQGEGLGMEWDGTVAVPIRTGMTVDKPKRVAVHNEHLFFQFPGGSNQHSEPGSPYKFTVLTGAGEIAVGEQGTGLLSSIAGYLAIWGRNKIKVLFGKDVDTWDLKTQADDSGAVAWTPQMIGSPIYLDNSGLRSLETSDKFGDFSIGTITQLVEPLFKAKREAGVSAVGALRIRDKGQYRLYWDDGTGITVYLGKGLENAEILPFDLGVAFTCMSSGKDDDGEEVLLAGDADGWVYQLDAGTSLNGDSVEAFCRFPFNHVGSPQQDKVWAQTVVEMTGGQNTELGIIAEFGYGEDENPPSQEITVDVAGGGGFYGEANWGEFFWSAPVNGQAKADTDGYGQNISVVVASNATYEEPHVLTGIILYFKYRKLSR